VKKLSLHANIGVQASEDVWGRVGVKEGARFTRHTSIQMVAGMGSEILSEYLTKSEPFESTPVQCFSTFLLHSTLLGVKQIGGTLKLLKLCLEAP